MSVFPLLVIVHALAATVWNGGHLVLDLGVLPSALRAQSAAYPTREEALEQARKLGCSGVHAMGSLWMPCAEHPE